MATLPLVPGQIPPANLSDAYNTLANAINATAASIPPVGVPDTSRLVIFGDSIVAQQATAGFQTLGSFSSPPTTQSTGNISLGYITRALMSLNWPLDLYYNAGVSGDTTTQMLARIGRDVLGQNPGVVIMNGGTNDYFNGVNVNTSISNLTSMYQQMASQGIMVVDTTLTAQSSQSQAQAIQRATINEFKMDYAYKNPNIYCCDIAGIPLDVSTFANSYGQNIASYYQDGLHENAYGAGFFAAPLAKLLNTILPQRPRRSFWNTDGSTNGDVNICNPNPLMIQGSGGTTGTNVTGTVAQNWTIYRFGAGTISAVASIVPRSSQALNFPTVFGDGKPGYLQQIDISGAGAANELITMQPAGNPTPGGGTGPWVAECEIAATAYSGTFNDAYLYMNMVNPAGTAFCFANYRGFSGDYMNANTFYGVLRTPPFYTPSGLSTFTPSLNLRTSVGGVSSVWVGNFSVRKLQA